MSAEDPTHGEFYKRGYMDGTIDEALKGSMHAEALLAEIKKLRVIIKEILA